MSPRTAPSLELRIGIHSGPVVAGVIGRHKFIYDVWGDTVNIASRLESQGVPGRIHVSENVEAALRHKYRFEGRGTIALKGKGNTTYLPAEASLTPRSTPRQLRLSREKASDAPCRFRVAPV